MFRVTSLSIQSDRLRDNGLHALNWFMKWYTTSRLVLWPPDLIAAIDSTSLEADRKQARARAIALGCKMPREKCGALIVKFMGRATTVLFHSFHRLHAREIVSKVRGARIEMVEFFSHYVRQHCLMCSCAGFVWLACLCLCFIVS